MSLVPQRGQSSADGAPTLAGFGGTGLTGGAAGGPAGCAGREGACGRAAAGAFGFGRSNQDGPRRAGRGGAVSLDSGSGGTTVSAPRRNDCVVTSGGSAE